MQKRSHARTFLVLAIVALVAAVLRYFLKGWLEPVGIPTVVGSFLASVTVVLLVGLVLLFSREGSSAQGHYFRAAGWFFALALWCELLVIGGILITERTGASTYYQGPWEAVHRAFPTAAEHAIGHAQGFLFRTPLGLLLGLAVYALSKRRARRR
jgi:hypothetical protein